jgi:uncharacterized protein (DUF58 family)
MSRALSYRRSSSAEIRRKPSLDFSITGLIYTSMMLFMGLAAINSQANLLFGVFGLMIGVLLVAGWISRTVLRKLEIRRVFPEYMVVGQTAGVQYEFHNQKRFWPSLSVTVGEVSAPEAFSKQVQAYLLHAAAGTKGLIPTQVIPKTRGLHQLDKFQLSTSFPFGFIKRAVNRRQTDNIIVYPPLAQVDPKLLTRCMSAEQTGARMKPRQGGADEFYGVKEYREGESPRFIYWRRSARTGTLVLKEMTHVAPPRLLIVVDTFVREHSIANLAAVEKTIAVAASLISRTIDQGLAVGLCAWSGDWRTINPTRGKRHSHELISLLARLPLNREHDHRGLLSAAHEMLESGTTPILLSPYEVEQNLSDVSRGNWLMIGANSAQTKQWFKFDSDIQFERCIPPEHRPAAA